MTVADLIAEIQKLPGYLPVKVLMPEVVIEEEFAGEYTETYPESSAQTAISAERRGAYVLITGDGK